MFKSSIVLATQREHNRQTLVICPVKRCSYSRLLVLILSLFWMTTTAAFPIFSADPVNNTGNCADCHGDFNAPTPYSSLTADDPVNWGQNLMNGHTQRYVLQCTDCHDIIAQAPVATNSSMSGITCSSCHGNGNNAGLGIAGELPSAGLRQHHYRAGITLCSNCHVDATPVENGGTIVPVPENIASPTFSAKGIDPCNEITFGTVVFGNTGLDNDGDSLRDGADSDCTPVLNTPPIANDDAASTQQDTSVTINVVANDTDDDGDVLSINSFDSTSTNGGAVTCAGAACSYTPAAEFIGTDNFTYDVSDGSDISNRATVSINVTTGPPPVNQMPACSGITPLAGEVGVAISFAATASDLDGDPLRYSWDFGDGATGVGATPSHTYGLAGTYTVILVVNDGRGGVGQCSANVSISDTPPPGDVPDNSGCSAITPAHKEDDDDDDETGMTCFDQLRQAPMPWAMGHAYETHRDRAEERGIEECKSCHNPFGVGYADSPIPNFAPGCLTCHDAEWADDDDEDEDKLPRKLSPGNIMMNDALGVTWTNPVKQHSDYVEERGVGACIGCHSLTVGGKANAHSMSAPGCLTCHGVEWGDEMEEDD